MHGPCLEDIAEERRAFLFSGRYDFESKRLVVRAPYLGQQPGILSFDRPPLTYEVVGDGALLPTQGVVESVAAGHRRNENRSQEH